MDNNHIMMDNLECMRIVIRGARRDNENTDDLIDRVKSDNTILTTLINSNPNFNNVGLVKDLIGKESFKKSL